MNVRVFSPGVMVLATHPLLRVANHSTRWYVLSQLELILTTVARPTTVYRIQKSSFPTIPPPYMILAFSKFDLTNLSNQPRNLAPKYL